MDFQVYQIGENEKIERKTSEPSGLGFVGLRHDNSTLKREQRRLLSTAQHDSSYGHILWRISTSNSRLDGIQKGQHLRHGSLQLLRTILVVVRRPNPATKAVSIIGNKWSKRPISNGGVLLHVGRIHFRDVLRNTKIQPCTAIRLHEPCDFVLPTDGVEVDEQH